ncbi:LysR family transcriptional regulator [Paenibacillus sp. H1-7]|uniref:LysR family transcriptional regulator n=1 Tax=Paenibacillus sp. H1-7 TaxID=2282849 RepID=UPI001EF75927|nr:LysR family transcriptional regulator [Paenibacillus sp. H1-7]ULL16171.1 LysR family transcriptional regulator [Paenibacillus sp. H1-7]
MELRQLEYFIAVCEELHFTRAAENIGISQPTLSQQIRSLEDELNIPLFDRVGKKIALTEAGKILYDQSIQIIRNLQNVKDAISELQSYQRGSLRIGTLPSDLDYRISALLVDFYHEFPKLQLTVRSSVEIVEQVLENEVDIGIGIMPYPDDRLVRIPICTEEYVLVVSENHALAHLESIALHELRHIEMVMFPKGMIGREIVDNCCREQGFTVTATMETSSITSVIHLVRANIGATVQPQPLIQSMNESTLRCIRIEDEAPTRSLGIIYRKDRFLGHAAQAFIGKVQQYFAQYTP